MEEPIYLILIDSLPSPLLHIWCPVSVDFSNSSFLVCPGNFKKCVLFYSIFLQTSCLYTQSIVFSDVVLHPCWFKLPLNLRRACPAITAIRRFDIHSIHSNIGDWYWLTVQNSSLIPRKFLCLTFGSYTWLYQSREKFYFSICSATNYSRLSSIFAFVLVLS